MRDVVIFGIGEVGKRSLPFLEKDNHVLFVVDNDETKWGSKFGKYTVKMPDSIKQQSCDVFITSTKYAFEIARQLQQMGINQDRIYFCHRFRTTDDSYEYEVYPLNEEKMQGAGKPLVQYDLLHAEEQETNHKKILVFCSFYSVYTKQLIENMAERYADIEFSLLTKVSESKKKIVAEQLKHIYCFRTKTDLKDILDQIPMYHAIQLLWIERDWAYFHKQIRKKAKLLNLNVGGSDFYRTGDIEKSLCKNLIACADRITAETKGTVCDFQKYYRDVVRDKMGLLPFGIEVLDFINATEIQDMNELKRKYQIPLNKVIVTCGHNAIEEHQHIKIIAALECLPEDIKKQIVCVFPMTYPNGREEYISKIATLLDEIGLEYVILTEFMDFQAMAEYALISDIMIHVQTTDQLSSTMLEEMYAGSVIIAGSWLPYKSLHEMGMYFLDVDKIPDVTAVLEDVVTNIDTYKEKCKGNKEIVWKHSSWDVLAPKWRALWD